MAGYGVLGAVGGYVAAHEWQKHQLREQDLQSSGAYDARRGQYDPNYRALTNADRKGGQTSGIP